MELFVLGAWVVQAAVGITLFVGWLRHARGRGAAVVLTHVGLSLAGLALWVWFLAGGGIVPAWIAFAAIAVGNAYGDAMLLQRHRRLTGVRTTFWRDYGAAIGAVFRGAFPGHVAFHAVFAGVVFFACLGVCIGASVAASS